MTAVQLESAAGALAALLLTHVTLRICVPEPANKQTNKHQINTHQWSAREKRNKKNECHDDARKILGQRPNMTKPCAFVVPARQLTATCAAGLPRPGQPNVVRRRRARGRVARLHGGRHGVGAEIVVGGGELVGVVGRVVARRLPGLGAAAWGGKDRGHSEHTEQRNTNSTSTFALAVGLTGRVDRHAQSGGSPFTVRV